jgi:glucose/arabinose dehydrogenase
MDPSDGTDASESGDDPADPPSEPTISLVNAFPSLNFTRPLIARQAPGNPNRWYIVEQRGRVFYFDNAESTSTKEEFLNITARVRGYDDPGGGYKEEQGLLGFAFDPAFETNGYFYVNYTGNGTTGTTIISRFSSNPGATEGDSDSEEILMEIDQPYSNHNGGHIEFGPDGFLYIGMGDGGSGGDPYGHGQNTNTLLGAILRIGVSGESSYTIPNDNPFVGSSGADEIYAYGLRNPWRFHFDREDGTLWAGDVGQDQFEEIDIITSGGNYGWNVREGEHCYESSNCDSEGMIDPVAEYNHSQGYSVTGGYVYRGTQLTSLSGKYLYADYGSGHIWTLTDNGDSPGYTSDMLLPDTGKSIASFVEDSEGEIYIVSLYTGEFLKLVESIE